MKLEESTAVLRPRSAWEAVDLGCALARRHWGPLMRGWFSVALPLWAIIALVCRHHPGWAMFLLWWTKPVLTRQPIHFLSRALFGAPPRVREFWRDWRNSLWRGLPGGLTFKRFAFQRSFRLPVLLLEGQSGAACTRRVNVLSAHGGGNAAWLSFVALKLELVVALGLIFWMDGFLTEGIEDWTGAGVANLIPDWFLWAANGFYATAIALIEPIYAAAGFALYINSRTHLEGWDIEVAFRRMTARLASAGTVAACLVLTAILMTESAGAADDSGDAKAVVEEVLKGPEFELEKRKYAVSQPEADDDGRFSGSRGGTEGAGSPLPGYFIMAAAAVFIAWLVWQNRIALRRNRESGEGASLPAGPRVVMGMDLAPESLPEDIPQAAWREYEAGRSWEALRLLYRGSLAWLVTNASLPVHESDTEGDCLRHTRQLDDTERVSFFESLTAAWIHCAYAGVAPEAAPMKRLCERWPFSLRGPSPSRLGNAGAWLLIPIVALLLEGCGKSGGDVKYEERPVGYKGAARANPWLAAEQMLNRMGTRAETRTAIASMPSADTALVVAADSIASRGTARDLLTWTSTGGHLIVACAGADRLRNDWRDTEVPKPADSGPLLEWLRIRFAPGEVGSQHRIDFGEGANLRLECDDNIAVDAGLWNPEIVAGDDERAVLASFPYHLGRVTLLASATPFRNRWIGNADHAAIFHHLIHLEPVTSVLFLSKSKVNFWHLLAENAWMPLAATALLIALWLWRHLPRFGPAIPPDDSRTRNFGAQLDEAGAFLDDRAGPAALLAAARRSVLHAAAQRGLSADAPDLIDHLAVRAGLPAENVRAALRDDAAVNDTITLAATLQRLHRNLGPDL